jgi:hypothetical protein
MTPQERVRADEINAAIERLSKNRRQASAVTIPGISRKPPVPTILPVSQERPATSGDGLHYGLIFTAVLVVLAAGFAVYTCHMEVREQRIRDEVALMLRAITEQEKARAEAEQMARRTAAIAEKRREDLNKSAGSNSSPKIEYNIYTPPAPAPRPQPVENYQPPVRQPAVTDRSNEHAAIAAAHLAMKKGIRPRRVSTTPVSGWDGRYRSEFEFTRNPNQGTTSPTPRRYEVTTQEKDGEITAIDLTTKGY